MRLIKKVQNNCEIMRVCNENHDVMENLHEGVILDKTQMDGYFKYTVYLSDIKIQSNIKLSVEFELYSSHSFKMYYFGDEYDLKQKIKLQIVL